ncbi:hypothetical protein [Fictibacillus gelatini]|uniref:hypothetical protein n=1 Tax=Fictibacillus gelatini TaxID=225985 RepID=UPI0012B660FF|nr:hypothetical protein [Fictibacillus gelatini]
MDCFTCQGNGELECPKCNGTGHHQREGCCQNCEGQGCLSCSRCNGNGRID